MSDSNLKFKLESTRAEKTDIREVIVTPISAENLRIAYI